MPAKQIFYYHFRFLFISLNYQIDDFPQQYKIRFSELCGSKGQQQQKKSEIKT